MKKSRFTEEQIVAVLQEHAAGAQASELCRRHGISTATLYGWRSRYGGMAVNELRRLKALEDENARLKRLVAQQALDNLMLKELLGKNG
jgi:putative transposase